MRRTHLLLAVLVAVIWGVNFVVIDVGLGHFPPLLFAALRFTLVALPAVFFVRRPGVAVRWVLAVGLFLGVGQFGLLFVAMATGMPAGLAALVLQTQALFTVLFAVVLLRELPNRRQLAGIAIAVLGMVLIGVERHASVPLLALLLTIAAGASWAVSNIATRVARPRDGLSLIVWASLVPPLPLTGLSLLIEGPGTDVTAFRHVSWSGLGALVYIVVLSTLVGYGIWTTLLREYPASQVAPFTLLVPVVGIAAAWLLLGEQPGLGELAGAVVVLAGLAVVSGLRRRPRTAPVRTEPAAETAAVGD
ncbi:MAG TPA: EamA family transporter [Streptosporangiales bacterium]